ncbi:ATPase [Bifidobacterium margollesii]|uniref:ATPase n=1 Tax=Bifidobacterium margollesii TaxID=2020964 RepID=A0A2N5JAP6_9BIFI|nr:ATP-binding protein [Bifidobacterium margollesii]PLS31265.1 ATPase [Bifidobacterium margollesii]
MIERTNYLEWITSLKDKHVIKVITGVRRSGKSTLLRQYRNQLMQHGIPAEQIIAIDLDLFENESLREKHALHQYIIDRMQPDRMNYIFIDEAQRCPGFEDAVESLYSHDLTDIYITGSNAHMLSSELATLLSGRFMTIPVLPLSFREFSQARAEVDPRQRFYQYLEWGGFPEMLQFIDNPPSASSYLEGVYNTVLVNDVSERHAIRDMTALKRIARYMYAHAGSLISAGKIQGALTSAGHKISQPTVDSYIDYLTDGMLFYEAQRFDLKGKDYLKLLAKYYAVDTGLRNYVIGYRSEDIGHMVENIVYLELLRRRYPVLVGTVKGREVDFVVKEQYANSYIQVALTIQNTETLEREKASLKAIPGYEARYVFALDTPAVADKDGIRYVNIIDWLLGNDRILP